MIEAVRAALREALEGGNGLQSANVSADTRDTNKPVIRITIKINHYHEPPAPRPRVLKHG